MTDKIKIARWPKSALPACLIAPLTAALLAGCTEAPAQDTAESRKVAAATASMIADQARTDRIEAHKRAERTEAFKRDLALSEIQRGIRSPDAH